jgi:Uncharacterised protein family (UPF0236)
MSPLACKQRTEVISVVCSLSVSEMASDVKALEEQIINVVQQSGREFYAKVFAAFQQRWLQQVRRDYTAVRWRSINQLTPFGLLRLPVRAVRAREGGRYFTLSKALFRPKATRLLSPLMERRALEAATGRNYRPAAEELFRWARARVSAWIIWKCVQFYGAKLCEQLERGWWPDRAVPKATPLVVTEIDSTFLKRQTRARAASVPVRHFPMHLGLHYSGPERRYARRGSLSVKLQHKRWILSTESMALFGRRLAWQRLRHFSKARHEVILSDGDEGVEWMREREFPQAIWLLDRWHIARSVRELAGNDQREYQRIMRPVWKADSEAVLEALRESPLQQSRPEQFHTLSGYLLGNRDGIDNWRTIPARLRRSIGRNIAPVRAGSGVIEKNIEVRINRRFKRQGRSWTQPGAEHLAQLLWLQVHPADWAHWWSKTALSKTRVNPGWPSCAPPATDN